MHALRNALVLALALFAVVSLLRAKLRVSAPADEVTPEELVAPGSAKPAPSTMTLARLEPLPNGDIIGVFTLHAGSALEVPVYPALPGDPPWLAYSDIVRKQKDGSWAPPMRGCCAEGVVKQRIQAGESIELAEVFSPPCCAKVSTTVRLSAKGAPDSEPFTLDFDACGDGGCLDRAYDEVNARLAASLRARGFNGPVVDAPDPALAVAEALQALAVERGRCQTGTPKHIARLGLRHFRLTGDVLFESGYIFAKSCTDFVTLEINLERGTSPKFDERGPAAARAPVDRVFVGGRPLDAGDELHALLYGE